MHGRVDGAEMIPAFIGRQPIQVAGKDFGGAQNQREGSADFMGDHGNEIAFETV